MVVGGLEETNSILRMYVVCISAFGGSWMARGCLHDLGGVSGDDTRVAMGE